MRTIEQQRADKVERDRRFRAYMELCHAAHSLPDFPTVERLAARSGRPEAEVRRIVEEYESRPHVHAVSTMHWFDRPCRFGREHPGCCPRDKECDEPGVYHPF